MTVATDDVGGRLRRFTAQASFRWDYSDHPLLAAARTALDTRLRPPTAVVSAPDGTGPSIGYAGVSDGVVKILQMLERQRERTGVPTHGQIASAPHRIEPLGAQLPDADLLAVAGTRSQLSRLPAHAALTLPYRLHAVVDTSDAGWRRRMSGRERRWCTTQVTRRQLRLELADDDASFHFFYDRMHLPTMRLRHGDRMRSETRTRAYHCLFRPGMLMFVTDGDTRLVGALATSTRDGMVLTPRLGGLLDGDEKRHDEGLLRLLSYLVLDFAERHGIRRVDFSGLEAWIASGLYGYKRRLAPNLVPPPDHRANLQLSWRAQRDTPPVRDFLVRNPVLERAPGGDLRAVYFHDHERPARMDIPYACANVLSTRTVDLDEFLDGVPRKAA
jgi:hypothetical protein